MKRAFRPEESVDAVLIRYGGLFRWGCDTGDMTTQYLTDTTGRKVAVVIPLAEYESLMEDLEDLAVAAERRDEERVSLEDVKRRLISDGLLHD